MNEERICELSYAVEDNVKFVKSVSDKIVASKAAELDNIISEIKTNVIDVPNIDDAAIEHYMMQLVYVLYTINTQVDNFSFYDSISAARTTLAYNEKYAESQVQAASANKKLTKDDHQQYAENNTIDEKMLNLIYSKSVKILKGKIDGGYETLDVLKRILKHHEQEVFYDKQNRKLLA